MRASALHQGLQVLDLLERTPCLRFGDLAERIETSTPTLSAILKLLAESNMVRKTSEGYALGSRFMSVAGRMLERMDIRALARPRLADLRDTTGNTVELSVPDRESFLFVEVLDGNTPLGLHVRVGIRLSNLNAMACGKIMLAHMAPHLREQFYEGSSFWCPTAQAIGDRQALESLLNSIRESGSAVDIEEARLGIMRFGAAVLDHTQQLAGMVTMPVRVDSVDETERASLAEHVAATARAISSDLGYHKENNHG